MGNRISEDAKAIVIAIANDIPINFNGYKDEVRRMIKPPAVVREAAHIARPVVATVRLVQAAGPAIGSFSASSTMRVEKCTE